MIIVQNKLRNEAKQMAKIQEMRPPRLEWGVCRKIRSLVLPVLNTPIRRKAAEITNIAIPAMIKIS